MSQPCIKTNITECARCANDHEGLVFEPFHYPVEDWTYWAMCPTVKQPILLKIETTSEPEETDKVQLIEGELPPVEEEPQG
jgi:hypothetical protein